MQIRDLAGFKRLLMAVAIASLIIAPAGAAVPVSNGTPATGTPLSATNPGQQVDDAVPGVEPILYQRSNNAWPYAKGPFYGTVDATSWNAGGVLHTRVGSFDLAHGAPDIPAELTVANRLDSVASQYFVLQLRPSAFTDGSFDAIKSAIGTQGGSIVSEMPVGAFVVRMTQGAQNAIKDSSSIVALQPYQPAYKLSPEIGRIPLLDAVKASSSIYSLRLQLFPGENPRVVAGALSAMGLAVKGTYADTVFVDADRTKLAAIASIDSISGVEEVLPIFLMSEETTTTVQTGRWANGSTPYTTAGIDGGGSDKASQADDQILMIIDNGIQLDNGDLSDTRVNGGFDGESDVTDPANGAVIANHRKVKFYGTTSPFGGSGDLLGCDGNTTSGVTHGHTVAAVALGNATKVPAAYGTGWQAVDPAGNFWGLDGLAPKARLIAYDGQVTPLTGRCDDVTQIPTPLVGITPLDPGDLYTAPSTGALPDSYAKGARTVNFSWGSVANTYDANAQDIDDFLIDYPDAMVFVAAGNAGRDKNGDRIPDPNTIGAPATAKNIISIGASRNADDLGVADRPNTRLAASSNGPATVASQRIAPLLMAPGTDAGSLGLASEFHCRSNDNDQFNAVECDIISGQISTSFASAAAAGAAMLVRDYFAQGFYPDGTTSNVNNATDKVPTISGALVKAILVSSAQWMGPTGSNLPYGPNLTRKFRGNREQGFGRIQMTNALPLQSYPGAVSGLIVGDGGPLAVGQVSSVNGTTLGLNIAPAATQSTTINVCDNSQPLTITIAWIDPSAGSQVSRDLDLEVTSPAGRKYLGNFFTDDVNDNAIIAGTEECTYTGLPYPPDSVAGTVDTGPWSLPVSGTGVTCTSAAAHVDGAAVGKANNVEAVFLSPDSRNNGVENDPATTLNEASDNQIEQGAWTVAIKANGTNAGPQRYSIAIAGGVCNGSAARVRKVLPLNQLGGTVLTCNDSVVITIDEVDAVGDIAPTAAKVAARTKVEVVDSNNVVTDTETFVAADFPTVISAGGNYRFDSKKILLTDGTLPESGNGALDVRDGNSIRVTYQDVSTDPTPDPNAKRIGTASVSCRPILQSGGLTFGQFGKDAFTLVDGGCEKDDRGFFTFGFPDRYMDDGELVQYIVAFQSAEIGTDLVNVSISLRAVTAMLSAPANCKPGSVPTPACTDPNRSGNPVSPYLTVMDSPKVYGSLPAGAALTPAFTIKVGSPTPLPNGATQKVDMLIGVTAKSAGKGVEALIAKREVLNADEFALFYSTDYPGGGGEPVGGYDINNNEVLETVTNDPANFTNDYFYETLTYSNMTATNPVATIKAPWNFDTNDGGFVSGLQNTARPSAGTFAQWGEDKNYNGKLDGFCDDGLKWCTLNHNHLCTVDVDCQPLDGFCENTTKTVPCTQNEPASQACTRCSLNAGRECSVNADCLPSPPNFPNNDGTCISKGTCDFTLGEDRNPAQGLLDSAWSTAGGCGWQTKNPGDPTGGVWHTGLIRAPGQLDCFAAGNNPADCQTYWATPDGDLVGDNNWWEILLTPILHKVNQGLDGSGDPIYQVAITNWAWNMLVDIPDTNTSVTLEFDTDVDKVAGVDLFNDAINLVAFRGKQGAISGGNAPITSGFNMFARINQCVDTDGNGFADHCGSIGGSLCNANKKQPDNECLGLDVSPTRGLCSTAPAQKKCTGNPNLNCTTDAQCNQRCSLNDSRSCQNPIQVGSTSTSCTSPTPNDGTCQDNVAVLGLTTPGEKCVNNSTTCNTTNDVCPGLGLGVCIATGGLNNREGDNNCAFEGIASPVAGAALAISKTPYGLATPNDDDAANGYCRRNDALDNIDKSISCVGTRDCDTAGDPYATVRTCSIITARVCASNADCAVAPAAGVCTLISYQSICNKPDSGVDEYVQRNGPGRNYGISTSNGPDMRFTTLEDFYGDTGTAFRASLGFNNREPDVNTSGISPGYGVAVDDMVISWKETRLDPDTHTCAGNGECATLDTSSGIAYEGNSVVSMTVVDKTPYDAVNNKNDCNGNGVYEATETRNCNNNLAEDVTVKLTSDAETAGEIAILDETSPGSHIYKGNFPYSTFYDSPGTLFVVQSGTSAPVVTARYEDRDDGTGQRCKNALEPSVRGFITSSTTVAATSGRITVNSYSVKRVSLCSGGSPVGQQCVTTADCGANGTCDPTTYGDDDGFADTNELCNLAVQFANKSGIDVEDLSATLGTTSPNIECITRSAIVVGALKDKALSDPTTYLPFQFKVANVNRTTLDQVLQAVFTITVRSNKFDALTRATTLTIDLDISSSGTAPGANANNLLYEDFEAGFGKFTREYIDANKTSIPASNGYRCQYNDPFALNSNSSTNANCFLGFTADPTTGVNDWHVHLSAGADVSGGMGRAFTGKQSLHLGVHLNSSLPDLDTTRLRHIMAIKTTTPINVGLAGANPELNFAQQVSFVDSSAGVNVSPGEAVDRGVVMAKPTSPSTATWIKLYPYANVYDQQGTDDFSNCVFDPVDDGNNEDSFFDPTDPARRLGPSSTCYPEFTFVHQGQTDYRKTFDVTDIGNASDGPGLQGCALPTAGCLPANAPSVINNPGTWVRPRFSLVPLAGRQIILRFLFSSIEIGATETMNVFFGRPNISADDGWYIDDIRLDGTVNGPYTLISDATVIASPLACGSCTNITPALVATPSSLASPGQIVTLSAKTSSVDVCKNGVLQFQFWNNTDGNGTVGDVGDTLLRDWTDNSSYIDAPTLSTQYGVKVRCSTDPACDAATNSIILTLPVTCPTSAAQLGVLRVSKTAGLGGAEPDNAATISWGGTLTVKVVRGDLVTLRSSAGVTNVETGGCLLNNMSAASVADAGVPASGAVYYLLQTPQWCNVALSGAYREGVASEKVGAGGNRDVDIAADADSCP